MGAIAIPRKVRPKPQGPGSGNGGGVAGGGGAGGGTGGVLGGTGGVHPGRYRSVLVLDPATSTGWCVMAISDSGRWAEIYAYGDLQIDTSSDFQGDWLIDMHEKVGKLMDTYFIDALGIEDYFFSKKFATGGSVNSSFRAIIHYLARQRGIPYWILGISAWKKFITGRSTPTAEQKKKWGAARAKKLYVQESLWERYGVRLPNHSISAKTGRPVQFKLDVVDVIAQAIYMARMILGVYEVVFSVPAPPDVKLSTTSVAFVYPPTK